MSYSFIEDQANNRRHSLGHEVRKRRGNVGSERGGKKLDANIYCSGTEINNSNAYDLEVDLQRIRIG